MSTAQNKLLFNGKVKRIIEKGGMPLARLQLRPPTREGEVINLNQLGEKHKTLWYLSFPWQSPSMLFVIPAISNSSYKQAEVRKTSRDVLLIPTAP